LDTVGLQDAKGNRLHLGPIIGQGGEGVVHEISTDSALVAKLYHRPLEGAKAEKLVAMANSATPEILKFAAWPLSTIHKNNRVLGLVMRKIPRGNRVIHELYTPKTRIREFPKANWLFLLHVGANVARGFAAIHKAGHIIGDVNHGNILVAGDGTTAFIDCDSFQVSSNGKIFVCEVGVPTYTPPELQNRPFKSIQRNPNHDSFGLAVLIFHLLFMGRHPFAGRFSGRGEMPIERAIAECRFPFGPFAQQVQMSPPPNSLTLGQVAPSLARAFDRAFSADAARGAQRPTAMEWLEHLIVAKTELSRCKIHQTHVFYSGVSECPWCRIEAQGIILFVDTTSVSTFGQNIDELWKQIAALPSLTSLPALPTAAAAGINVVPTPLCRTHGIHRRIRMAIGLALVAVVVVFTFLIKMDGGIAAGAFIGAVLFAFFLPRRLQTERRTLASITEEYRKKYSQIQSRYPVECSDQPFAIKIADLQKARGEYNSLPVQRQRKLQDLERNKYQLQLTQFLDRFNLSDAKIQGIGIGRKQMLSSYGVDTAADITPISLSQVPGIGPKFAERLLKWRAGIEPRFRFDPQKAIDRLDIEKIDREIRSRRIEIEGQIKKGVTEAVALHGNIATRRRVYIDQSLNTLRALAQAEANFKAS
jgi:DNA-binding helix-hairpin-helix protein with protein kinase domain